MRNRIIHGYDAVDDELVWLTATHHIPILSNTLEQRLQEQPNQDAGDDNVEGD